MGTLDTDTMNKLIAPVSVLVMIFAIAGMFVWQGRSRTDQTAVILLTPLAVPTAAMSMSPVPTSLPTPTPTINPSPKLPVNTRADYVRTQLTAAGIDTAQFNAALADKRLVVYPVKTVAYKDPDWTIIENKLYSAASVQRGKDYIRAHQAVFDQAELDYGVKKEALAGLIAIETDFGKNAGTYPIFNVLYSRMMRWPAATWKTQADQLVAFTQYCTQSNIDCYSVKGSYAGAFGIVQFMPNSLLSYGVDGDHNGVINLSQEIDAIPSAANFLKQHGWDQDPLKSLARYYGSSIGYPGIVLTYADLLAK